MEVDSSHEIHEISVIFHDCPLSVHRLYGRFRKIPLFLCRSQATEPIEASVLVESNLEEQLRADVLQRLSPLASTSGVEERHETSHALGAALSVAHTWPLLVIPRVGNSWTGRKGAYQRLDSTRETGEARRCTAFPPKTRQVMRCLLRCWRRCARRK